MIQYGVYSKAVQKKQNLVQDVSFFEYHGVIDELAKTDLEANIIICVSSIFRIIELIKMELTRLN